MSDLQLESEWEKKNSSWVKLNESFSRQALIPAKPTGKPVLFYGKIRDLKTGTLRQIKLRVGSVAKNHASDETGDLCPGLHIDLWRLICTLLSFYGQSGRRTKDGYPNPTFNEVWKRLNATNKHPSKPSKMKFGRLMKELEHLRMSVRIDDGDEEIEDVVNYRTIKKTFNFCKSDDPEDRVLVFTGFKFNLNFLTCILYCDDVLDVRLDMLGSMTSSLARAAYLWLPAGASHRKFDSPVSMTEATNEERSRMNVLTSKELWGKLGLPPQPTSTRKKILTQNAKSVLGQLHGRSLLSEGWMLGVSYWERSDDFVIGTYTYRSGEWAPGSSANPDRNKPKSALEHAFVVEGQGNRDAYTYLVSVWWTITVDQYQLERLTKAGVRDVEKSIPFYQRAIAIIGPDLFQDAVGVLSESTVTSDEGGGPLFTNILKRMVAQKAKIRTEKYDQDKSSGAF